MDYEIVLHFTIKQVFFLPFSQSAAVLTSVADPYHFDTQNFELKNYTWYLLVEKLI